MLHTLLSYLRLDQTLGHTGTQSDLPQLCFDTDQWSHLLGLWDHHSWLDGEIISATHTQLPTVFENLQIWDKDWQKERPYAYDIIRVLPSVLLIQTVLLWQIVTVKQDTELKVTEYQSNRTRNVYMYRVWGHTHQYGLASHIFSPGGM